jgi:hypothetical protein
MFRDAWDRYRSNSKDEAARHRTRLKQIDTEVASMIKRAARTQHNETAQAYEARIVELRSETAVLEEKLASQRIPEGNFDSMFELSLQFLASPWEVWGKASYELKRTIMRLVFSASINVSRETGLRTAETTLPFKALQFVSTSGSQMVHPTGFEPVTSAFGGQPQAPHSRFVPHLFLFSAWPRPTKTAQAGAKQGPNAGPPIRVVRSGWICRVRGAIYPRGLDRYSATTPPLASLPSDAA